jgi:hypothetical protein
MRGNLSLFMNKTGDTQWETIEKPRMHSVANAEIILGHDYQEDTSFW